MKKEEKKTCTRRRRYRGEENLKIEMCWNSLSGQLVQ